MIISLVDRVITLSHPDFHKENFDSIVKILINNGYPLDLIFSTIRKRFYFKFNHSKQKKHSQTINVHTPARKIYFTIPYFSFIAKNSYNISRIFLFANWFLLIITNSTNLLKHTKILYPLLLVQMSYIR